MNAGEPEGNRAARGPRPGRIGSDRPARGGGRESIESFVVVVVAFLVWSLEAEGFVIPTGSMAPTLVGRHKDVTCPECGYAFTVDANREAEPSPSRRGPTPRIAWGTCENCRYAAPLADLPSTSGDRIYVMKQGLSLPFLERAGRVRVRRWDVAVFKQPEEPEVRFIKRVVGMPDEVLRIQGGDVWVRPRQGDAPFERPLRPLEHQQAMQVLVYDDRHRPASLRDDPAWRRWTPAEPGAWSEPEPDMFEPGGSSPSWAELRYHHLAASPDQWDAISKGEPTTIPRPSLITDFSSYNTDATADDRLSPTRSARASAASRTGSAI